jgi:hypothetical protein
VQMVHTNIIHSCVICIFLGNAVMVQHAFNAFHNQDVDPQAPGRSLSVPPLPDELSIQAIRDHVKQRLKAIIQNRHRTLLVRMGITGDVRKSYKDADGLLEEVIISVYISNVKFRFISVSEFVRSH